jgi:CRP-like cAMP-binding protein
MPAEPRNVSHVDRVLLLRKTAVLGTLPAAAIGQVAEYARERSFPAGGDLLRSGEAAGALYYVVEGQVRLSRRGQDLGLAGAGTGVGELALLARDAEGLSARAEVDTLTLQLSQESVLEMFDDHFAIFQHVLREMCREIIRLLRRLPAGTVNAPVMARPLEVGDRELDLVERILFLRQAAPFRRSSINALAELSRGLTEVRFEPGTVLWEEGFSSRAMFLIAQGTVQCRSARGYRMTVGAGNPLGGVEAMGDVPRWYEAVTETPVVALAGDVDTLLDVFEDNMEMGVDYLAIMAQWMLRLHEILAPQPAAAS